MMNVENSDQGEDGKESESNSTCFEAVSAKNSKLSASEHSSKGPGQIERGQPKKNKNPGKAKL